MVRCCCAMQVFPGQDKSVDLVAARDIQASEPLLLSYGNLSNDFFLLDYGQPLSQAFWQLPPLGLHLSDMAVHHMLSMQLNCAVATHTWAVLTVILSKVQRLLVQHTNSIACTQHRLRQPQGSMPHVPHCVQGFWYH